MAQPGEPSLSILLVLVFDHFLLTLIALATVGLTTVYLTTRPARFDSVPTPRLRALAVFVHQRRATLWTVPIFVWGFESIVQLVGRLEANALAGVKGPDGGLGVLASFLVLCLLLASLAWIARIHQRLEPSRVATFVRPPVIATLAGTTSLQLIILGVATAVG